MEQRLNGKGQFRFLATTADGYESILQITRSIDLTLENEVETSRNERIGVTEGYVTRVEVDKAHHREVRTPSFFVKVEFKHFVELMRDSQLKSKFYERYLVNRSYDDADVSLNGVRWKYFIYAFHLRDIKDIKTGDDNDADDSNSVDT